jgi:phosphatidylethanolamine/phosphatidyl-N-methylethanolamine N-methyltransferase
MTWSATRERERAADGWAVFLLHWLKSPIRMGAALPSGPRVGRALARQMQLERAGPILELGAGTGTIARELIAGGCPPQRLILVESEPQLSRYLRVHYPEPVVINGDAKRMAALLDDIGVPAIASVISSLPITWFTLAEQRSVVMPCLQRLGRGGSFIQITNAPASPVNAEALDVRATRVGAVWLHFLPIQIWRYWLD